MWKDEHEAATRRIAGSSISFLNPWKVKVEFAILWAILSQSNFRIEDRTKLPVSKDVLSQSTSFMIFWFRWRLSIDEPIDSFWIPHAWIQWWFSNESLLHTADLAIRMLNDLFYSTGWSGFVVFLVTQFLSGYTGDSEELCHHNCISSRALSNNVM